MKAAPDWNVEGRDWPNRAASHFVPAAGFVWHVQIMGDGVPMLLIHGTGAATHSWRALMPLLAASFRIVAVDLPGHGFTEAPPRGAYSLPQIAAALSTLLCEMKVCPDYIVGHSAGAAIAIRMALDGRVTPRKIVSINGALMPFPGLASVVFPALAKLLFLNPLAAPLLAWRAADTRAVARLIEGTGSTLDPRGLELYARLLETRRHIGAAVGMMSKWDLFSLHRDLAGLRIPLTLLAAKKDLAVPLRDAHAIAAMVPDAEAIVVEHYGHLAHEEAPALFAGLIQDAAA